MGVAVQTVKKVKNSSGQRDLKLLLSNQHRQHPWRWVPSHRHPL